MSDQYLQLEEKIKALSLEEQIKLLRSLVRLGNHSALKQLLPLVQKHRLQEAFLEDLRAFLDCAERNEDEPGLHSVVQLAALLGDQDLLLQAQTVQASLRGTHPIVVEDDAYIIGVVSSDFKATPEGLVYVGEPGALKREWAEHGMLPSVDDETFGEHRRDFGKGE